MGKVIKKVVGAVTSPLAKLTGAEDAARKAAAEQQAAAEAEAQRQATLAAQAPASTATGTAEASADVTPTTEKKVAKRGRKDLTVARTTGAGLNV